MKRVMNLLASAVFLSSVVFSTGCISTARDRWENRPGVQSRFDEVHDMCWPARYNYEARKPVVAVFGAQVNNGHILDQTIVNGDFEQGTDKLTAGGIQRLSTLSRSRPADGNFYLAKSRDVNYDPAKPEDYTAMSSELDAKRVSAIQKYLNATNSGRNINYTVTVIDPQDQLTPASGPASAFRAYPIEFQAGINGGGVAAVGVGGATPTANVTAGVPQAGTGPGR